MWNHSVNAHEISQRLTTVSEAARLNHRVVYEFQNEINVIDLGLRLSDVQQYGLRGESCRFKGHFAADSICTEKEKRYLLSNRRVELNEFTAPQFIQYVKAKLTQHLCGRLIPADDVLTDAYRRAQVVTRLNGAIKEILDDAIDDAKQATIPKTLRQQLRAVMKKNPDVAWDVALCKLCESDSEERL
jgi:hypothetical protein